MRTYYTETFKPTEILEYLRKSRSDDPLLSVEEVLLKHEHILNDYALRNFGDKVPDDNTYREVASSETIDGRPEMLKLLKEIENPRIKAILVVEVQRLSRGDLEDAGRLIKLLRYTNTKVITPQKTYDLNDEYDRDAFERELKRGNEYLEYFKKIQARGRIESVKEGNYIGSVPPYGYNKVFIQEGKRKCPTLEINEEQADVVRMIFDMYVNQDMGTVNICNRLDSLDITPPKGKYWSPAALKDMLSNVHYIGKIKWNYRKTVTIVQEQEIMHTRPKAKDYLIFEGKHEAIIDDELFAKAQEKIGRNHRAKSTTKIRNPLASLLYCQCGRAMSLRTYSKNGVIRSAPRLLCDDQTHCKTPSVCYDEFIAHICNILEQSIDDFKIKMHNSSPDTIKSHEQTIKRLEKKLKMLEEKELLQWESQSDPNPENRMPADIFRKLNAKLQKEKKQVQQSIEDAYNSSPTYINYSEKIEQFSNALAALQDDNLSAAAKNRYLKNIIDRIEYSRSRESANRASENFDLKITFR